MDTSIEACVARALISANSAICGAAYSHQYHTQGTYNIADRASGLGLKSTHRGRERQKVRDEGA
jgi:hypothetical protein